MNGLTTPRRGLTAGLRTALAVTRRRLTSAGRRLRSRRAVSVVMLLTVTLVGVLVGVALGGRTVTDIGPFRAELSMSPSLTGETSVFIPPLGSLHFDSHEAPAQLTVALGSLDQARTQAIIDEPGGIQRVSQTVADDVIDGIVRLGFAGLGSAVLGAMLLSALVYRDTRRVAIAGGVSLALVLASYGAAAATFRFNAVEEPRYEGLLVNAPALVGDVQRIADEWEQYAEGLQSMVANVSLLYTTVSTLPVAAPGEDLTRVLHVSDLHLNPSAWRVMTTVVEQYDVDFIVDTGDIVDWGTAQESVYVESIGDMQVPYVYVRGNHDSSTVTQEAVAEQPNAIVLDDEVMTLDGLTVAGIGDPRFTPDRSTDPFVDQDASSQRVIDSGEQLAETIRTRGEVVQIAAVHDPLAATPLEGLADNVLAGHRHSREVRSLGQPPDGAENGAVEPGVTRLMVQGSSGGAGLRGLEGEHPEPLAMSVLYFDSDQRMVAYDDITIGGTGMSEVSLQRNIVSPGDDEPAEVNTPGPLDGTPSPTPSP